MWPCLRHRSQVIRYPFQLFSILRSRDLANPAPRTFVPKTPQTSRHLNDDDGDDVGDDKTVHALGKNVDYRKVAGEARPLKEAIREGMEDVNGLLECLDRYPRPSPPCGLDYIKDVDLKK